MAREVRDKHTLNARLALVMANVQGRIKIRCLAVVIETAVYEMLDASPDAQLEEADPPEGLEGLAQCEAVRVDKDDISPGRVLGEILLAVACRIAGYYLHVGKKREILGLGGGDVAGWCDDVVLFRRGEHLDDGLSLTARAYGC